MNNPKVDEFFAKIEQKLNLHKLIEDDELLRQEVLKCIKEDFIVGPNERTPNREIVWCYFRKKFGVGRRFSKDSPLGKIREIMESSIRSRKMISSSGYYSYQGFTLRPEIIDTLKNEYSMGWQCSGALKK